MRNAKSGKSLTERIEHYSMPVGECGCNIWLGAVNTQGYGLIGVGKSGKIARAHRVSWSLKNGPIPAGKMVLHRCDLPSCVNPDHLYIGDAGDNTRDMDGRGRRGFVKATQEIAREIRASSEKGVRLAARFGLSEAAISRIRSGERWTRA